MAFSKIVGLDVTPRRPSSAIIRARSPLSSIARRMLSYQMLCPSFCNSISGFIILLHLFEGNLIAYYGIMGTKKAKKGEKSKKSVLFGFLPLLLLLSLFASFCLFLSFLFPL